MVINVPLWCRMSVVREAVHEGAGDTWEFPILSAQFFCKAKSALKIKFTIKQKEKKKESK